MTDPIYGETDCTYVSIRGIAGLCDKKPNRAIWSDAPNFKKADYANLRDYDTVFVTTYDLKSFLNEVFYVQDRKIILVTGCSDISVPYGICRLHRIVGLGKFLRSSNLIHWFTTNCDITHSKVTCIPIGVDYHTLTHDSNHSWGSRMSPVEQENILITCIPNETERRRYKTNRLYSNFHLNLSHPDRKACLDVIRNTKWLRERVIFEPRRVDRRSTWNKHRAFAFELSPLGNGMDCHRTWEALILKTIPVVPASSIAPVFDGLPVVQVQGSWDRLTSVELDTYYAHFDDWIDRNADRLRLRYWHQKIHAAKPHANPRVVATVSTAVTYAPMLVTLILLTVVMVMSTFSRT